MRNRYTIQETKEIFKNGEPLTAKSNAQKSDTYDVKEFRTWLQSKEYSYE